MAIKTNVRMDGESVVVSISGMLDFETTDSFRENLFEIEKQVGQNQVVFDLGLLEFVGSSGISAFIQTLREFNSRLPSRPRYVNVRSEFKRIITAFDENKSFDFWDSRERALKSFDN